MIRSNHSFWSNLLILTLCLGLINIQLLNAVPMPRSLDEQECLSHLDQAEENYYNGDLDQSISLVRQCLESQNLQTDTRIRAYKILARCYMAGQQPDSAKKAIIFILNLDPSFQPTIEQESPRFINLVTETKKEQALLVKAGKKTLGKPWIWIGAGGVAVAAVIVLVAAGSGAEEGNNQNQALAAPPALP